MVKLHFSDGKSVGGSVNEGIFGGDIEFTCLLPDGFMMGVPTHFIVPLNRKYAVFDIRLFKQEFVGEQGDRALTLHTCTMPA